MLLTLVFPMTFLTLITVSMELRAGNERFLATSIPSSGILESRGEDTYKPNNDNTCGHVSGLTCNPKNAGGGWCCSSFGFCGNGHKYCGKGCQEQFGKCNFGKSTNRPPHNRHCGPKHKNRKCSHGYCCSVNGLCGDSPSFCGQHCQRGFGRCDESKVEESLHTQSSHCRRLVIPSSPTYGELLEQMPKGPAPEERCGPQHDGRICSVGKCCSQAGYCGIGKDYCSVPQNCQRAYGRCDSDVSPAGFNTSSDHRQLSGKVPYDKMISQCLLPRTIALTFDDGPSENTNELLDILRAHNAKATFFIAGNNNGKGPIDQTDTWVKLIQRAYAEGHQIASHSWSHPHMDHIDSWERKEDMYKNERAIANIIGKYPTYMRPPYIECGGDSGCMADMKSLGYHIVSWGVDSTDWAHVDNLNAMINAVDAAFDSAHEDGNMLFIQHDTIPKSAIDLTKHILKRISEMKWKAVTITECLGEGPSLSYRQPSWIDPSSLANDGCILASGNSCIRLKSFTTRESCFTSSMSCLQQLNRDIGNKLDSNEYRLLSDICNNQLLFCADCGKSKNPECDYRSFRFKIKNQVIMA